MKISAVTVHILKSKLEQPFAFSQGWVTQRSATLVEVSTNEGITGWGEAFAQGLEPPEIAAAAIQAALTPIIIGKNPLDTEVLWHDMYHKTRDFGRKGSVVAGISAIDMALWDISGKYLQQSVATLMGGFFRRRIQPYATGFYRLKGHGESARLADEALRHYDNGFRKMKIKLGYGIDDDLAVMNAIGIALQGKNVGLMIDTNHAYSRNEALQLGRALEQYDLLWYEEPVVPEDREGYRELRNKLDMPIAGGENEHTLYGFNELLHAQAIDIAQPDPGSCGGITACKHIAALAQANGVRVNPHVWGSAVAQAASLQILAALPVTNFRIFQDDPVLEFDTSSHPFRNDLVANPLRMHEGFVDIPDQPGLGIEINNDVIRQYSQPLA